MSGDPRKELLRRWNTEQDFAKRNAILKELTDAKLFPGEYEDSIELEAGLYPDLPDPHAKLYNSKFLTKLLQKQEFIEDKQQGIQSMMQKDQSLLELLESDASACGPYKEGSTQEDASVTPFELSPTQRFIGRFLSPQTPYNSALLFHGVGLGKTCSGITVAENFLEMFPRKEVYIIAPPTIQAGWMREIFSMRKLTIGKKPGVPNTHNGCTGNTYLRLTSTEYERDASVIKKKVEALIKSRYKIMGYLQFYNYVMKYLTRNISKELSEENRKRERRKYLDQKFSGKLLIIDEAHNLRDAESEVVEAPAKPPAPPPKETPSAPPPPPPAPVERSSTPPPPPAPVERPSTPPKVNTTPKNDVNKSEDEEDEGDLTGVQGEDLSEEESNENNEVELTKVDGEDLGENMAGGANADLDVEYGSEEEEEEVELTTVQPAATTTQAEFAGEEKDTQAQPEDKQDILKGGKKVTPLLREILSIAEGMKFLLLTATPMYNDYKEIIGLLNLLLLNDKRATLTFPMIFETNGEFKPEGRELLGRVAGSYVSFMRGENPLSFPIRLKPDLANLEAKQADLVYKIGKWPKIQPDGTEIPESERTQVVNLPYVACRMDEDVAEEFLPYSTSLIEKEKLTIPTTDKLIQAGNFLYPLTSTNFADRVGKRGFDSSFVRNKTPVRFSPTAEAGAEWMVTEYEGSEPLLYHSPKANYLVNRLATTKGVAFVYSRFVETGALTLALILEANGYTCASRKNPLLDLSEPIDAKGRQCALCPLREANHKLGNGKHEFVPAQYVLLTGEKDYSPNNKAAIELATDPLNYNGSRVKVVVGSTIASEGIDLKFIRELFVFDSWYHLSKLEQVIGRGIRYKSHCLLPPLQRNCTINLLVLSYGKESTRETIDMFQYRRGYTKAKLVGQVTRVLKSHALDCNLNKELILIQGLGPIDQIDGQGLERTDINVNDTPYTNVCDWLETCDYKCSPEVDLSTVEIDNTTYDEYAAKWRTHQIKKVLRDIFQVQPWRHFDDLENNLLAQVPRIAKAAILDEIVGNPSFRIRVGDKEGYIIYKNGYYLFQPEMLWDKFLPISLRIKNFPVKRDEYEPIEFELPKPVNTKPKPVAKPTAANKPVEEGKEAEAEALPVVEAKEVTQMRAFWDLTVEWSKNIASGKAGAGTPTKINDLIQSRYANVAQKTIDAIKLTFEMVGRLYQSVKGNEALRRHMSAVLLEFVWDEYLTSEEIQALYSLNPESPEIKLASKENVYQYGSTATFRFVNPTTNALQYICGGAACAQSIVDGIKAQDPLYSLKADRTTTGPLYGLNIGKEGKILFKSNDSVPQGEKPAIGRLCYSVANMKDKYVMLNNIAEMARAIPSVASDLDLSTEKTKGIKTPARVCTLADLSLRLLDKVRHNNLRYFYRPVSSILSGHTQK